MAWRDRFCYALTVVFVYALVAIPGGAQQVALMHPTLLYNRQPGLDAEVIEDIILRELRRGLDSDAIPYVQIPPEGQPTSSAADFSLLSEYGIGETRLFVSVSLIDPATEATISGASGQTALDLGVFNQASRLYSRIRGRLIELLAVAGHPKAPRHIPRVVTDLQFTGPQDDVTLRDFQGNVLGVTQNGRVSVDHVVVGPSSRLSIRLERDGFHPQNLTVDVLRPSGDEAVRLPRLERATRLATFLGWSPQQVVGAALGGRYYLQTDTSYLQGEGHLTIQNDFEGGTSGGSNHVDLRVAGGRYIGWDYSAWFRVALEAAFGGIRTTFPGREIDGYWDPYVTPLAIVLEANGRNVSIFTRLEARFALGGEKAFFSRGILEPPGQDVPLIAMVGVLSKW